MSDNLHSDSESEKAIGLFDSGLGGLTVLRELKAVLPGERYVYLGDTARTPYGSKGCETIVRYSRECSAFLLKNNIKLLVVACNTASSMALSELRREIPCPVVGTIEQAVRLAVGSTKNGRVGVIGTEATISSGVYQSAITGDAPSVRVLAKACPLFVPLVEQGMVQGEIPDKVVEYYLRSFREEKIDTLVLGCTHYPLLKDAIMRYMGDDLQIVECSKAIAIQVKDMLQNQSMLFPQGSIPVRQGGVPEEREKYFVTDGVSRFNVLAGLFLGDDSVSAVKVDSF